MERKRNIELKFSERYVYDRKRRWGIVFIHRLYVQHFHWWKWDRCNLNLLYYSVFEKLKCKHVTAFGFSSYDELLRTFFFYKTFSKYLFYVNGETLSYHCYTSLGVIQKQFKENLQYMCLNVSKTDVSCFLCLTHIYNVHRKSIHKQGCI